MSNPLARRWFFWQQAFSSKVRAVTGVIVTVFTVILIIRDGMVNPANREWFLFKYIPSLPWYWWLIIGVAALAVLSLEGAYTVHAAEHSKLLAKHKQRVSEIRNEYRERLDSKHLGELVEARRIELNGGIPKPPELARPPTPAEPNIAYQSSDVIDVHRAHRGLLEQGQSRDHGGFSTHFPAVIATYRNKILNDRQIGGRHWISAQLSFVGYEENALLTTNRIVWLGTNEFTVSFGINDPHSLVVAVLEKNQLCAIQENTTDDYHNPTKTIPLKGDLHKVYIELVSESESKIVANTELMLDLTWNPLGIKLERVYQWKDRKLAEIVQAAHCLMDRLNAGENKTQIEKEYEKWEAHTARFVVTHWDETFMKRFRPPPYEPPPGTPSAFKHLRAALEPVGLYNKIRAKVEILERFKNEVV